MQFGLIVGVVICCVLGTGFGETQQAKDYRAESMPGVERARSPLDRLKRDTTWRVFQKRYQQRKRQRSSLGINNYMKRPLVDVGIRYSGVGKRQIDTGIKHSGIGKRQIVISPAMRHSGLGKRAPSISELQYSDPRKRQNVVSVGIRYSGLGKRDSINSGIRYSGLNKRDPVDAGMRHSGLGKRQEIDSAIRYSGLGKRDTMDSGIRYSGLGKRDDVDSGYRYSGLGKRDEVDSGIRYSGLGKRDEVDSGIRYSGLGKRQYVNNRMHYADLNKRDSINSAMRYSGLGKREYVNTGMRYSGVGKRQIQIPEGMRHSGLGKRYDIYSDFRRAGLKRRYQEPFKRDGVNAGIRYSGLGKRKDESIDSPDSGYSGSWSYSFSQRPTSKPYNLYIFTKTTPAAETSKMHPIYDEMALEEMRERLLSGIRNIALGRNRIQPTYGSDAHARDEVEIPNRIGFNDLYIPKQASEGIKFIGLGRPSLYKKIRYDLKKALESANQEAAYERTQRYPDEDEQSGDGGFEEIFVNYPTSKSLKNHERGDSSYDMLTFPIEG